MGLWQRLFGAPKGGEAAPLYAAIVARARQPHWYQDGAVPDTIDGRFDMVASIMAVVLIRLEAEPAGAAPGAHLAELFIADMDAQLREIGIGDLVVGKQVGRMMGMLGGRLGAYRDGLAGGDLHGAVVRNVYRGAAPDAAALDHVCRTLQDLNQRLAATPITALLGGTLP